MSTLLPSLPFWRRDSRRRSSGHGRLRRRPSSLRNSRVRSGSSRIRRRLSGIRMVESRVELYGSRQRGNSLPLSRAGRVYVSRESGLAQDCAQVLELKRTEQCGPDGAGRASTAPSLHFIRWRKCHFQLSSLPSRTLLRGRSRGKTH